MNRLSRHEYYMDLSRLTAKRSTCRVSVGAVAIKDKRVVMTSYNGAPSKREHCSDVGCNMIDHVYKKNEKLKGSVIYSSFSHCNRTIHAEQNIITQCAKHGISLNAATIYTTHQPCFECTKLLLASGVEWIFYDKEYKDERFIEEYNKLNRIFHYKEALEE